MVVRKTTNKDSQGNCIVLIKQSDKGSFGSYSEVIDKEGTVMYIPYDDLNEICNGFKMTDSKIHGTFNSQIDITKIYNRIDDNLVVSRHYLAYRLSPVSEWQTKEVVYFWRKIMDNWGNTYKLNFPAEKQPAIIAGITSILTAKLSKPDITEVRKALATKETTAQETIIEKIQAKAA